MVHDSAIKEEVWGKKASEEATISAMVFSSQQLFSKIIRPPSLQDLIGAFLGPVGEEHLTPSKACFLPCFDAQTLEGSTLIKPLYF